MTMQALTPTQREQVESIVRHTSCALTCDRSTTIGFSFPDFTNLHHEAQGVLNGFQGIGLKSAIDRYDGYAIVRIII